MGDKTVSRPDIGVNEHWESIGNNADGLEEHVQGVSVEKAALPTGAATETTLSAISTKLGEVQANPTSNTLLDRLKALLTGIVLATGSNIIGRVGFDQTTPGTTNGVQVNAALPAGSNLIGKVQPMSAILEGGLTEIIDKDDTEVSQNDYSKSVGVALGGTYSGEILQISLYATEVGTGAVRANSGVLLIFDADPTVSAGDTALALADWQSAIAKVLVTDWSSDTGGGMATITTPVAFHDLSTLYFVFLNQGTAFNDAAGDDEELAINFWWRRES